MPMELVEFVDFHQVQISLDLLDTEEMTSFVKMETTVSETWSIIDCHDRKHPGGVSRHGICEYLDRKHLLDGLHCIIESTKT